MPRDDWLMGSVAAQDTYNLGEGAFQAGIRATPWYDEFVAKYGEAPDLNTPDYNYRAAWAAGARPTVRDPGDQLLHWDSRFKGENHPNRYVGGVDTKTGKKMGDLAATDVYNAFDVPGEQSTNVGWANRLGEILTARPQYDETVQYTTASPLVNITEGDIGRATEAAMGASGGGLSTKGIRAYHSSPHDFVPEPGYPLGRFDTSKALTGEGAQMHGPGVYLAESPAVSGRGGQYDKQFTARTLGKPLNALEEVTLSKMTEGYSDLDILRELASRGGSTFDEASAILDRMKKVKSNIYEVNINADPAQMMNLDTRLGAQNPVVQDYFRKQLAQFGPEAGMEAQYKIAGSRGGGLGRITEGLREAGIPGIKYLDQGSRGMNTQILSPDETTIGQWLVKQIPNGQVFYRGADEAAARAAFEAAPKPSSNYVVFDPNIIDIMKKYGIAGVAPVGMGALAAQDRYQQ